MKADILVFGAHPDDIELAASGTVAAHIALGKKVVLVDLTSGELGTRGNAELRKKEAAAAAKVLGIEHRTILDLADGFFENNETSLKKIIEQVRLYQPEIVLANARSDRHPDHGRGGDLVSRACFLSGLVKIETQHQGQPQQAWRPKAVYRYIQDHFIQPDIVVDITDYAELKMQSIQCYASQFYTPGSTEPVTPISTPEFLDAVKGRMVQMGRYIGVRYGEGFTFERPAGVKDLTLLD
jgi:bacillithiol biosynthesis deacetylase BshB1